MTDFRTLAQVLQVAATSELVGADALERMQAEFRTPADPDDALIARHIEALAAAARTSVVLQAERLAELHRLITALVPHEAAVRALIDPPQQGQ